MALKAIQGPGPNREEFEASIKELLDGEPHQAILLVMDRKHDIHWAFLNHDQRMSRIIGLMESAKLTIHHEAMKQEDADEQSGE